MGRNPGAGGCAGIAIILVLTAAIIVYATTT